MKVQSIEDHITELKDYKNRHTKECTKVSSQDRIITELRDKITKRDVEVQEYRALKERCRMLVHGNGN